MKCEEKRRLLLSDTGQYITKIQEDLADEFHYNELTNFLMNEGEEDE